MVCILQYARKNLSIKCRRGASIFKQFFGGGARFDLAAPSFSPVNRLYTYFTFMVSPWQGQRHSFEGGGTILQA